MTKDSNACHLHRVLRGGAAVAVAAVLVAPGLAAAAPGSATDPDDVTLRLDLKAVSHSDDGTTVTLTSQTYEAFKDEWADFKWGIDKDGDESFDLIVFAEWDEGELVGGVDDAAEEPVSLAQVTRPGPDSIAVSFAAKILGKSTSYRYGALAATDLNGNGEEDAGETDVAPNSGLYTHDLTAAPAPATATAVTPKAAPNVAAPAKPAVTRKGEATPAPASEASGKPTTVAAPKPGSAATKATPAAPAKAAAPVAPPAPGPETAADPAATPAPTPNPSLARTGPLTDILLILAGLVLLVGGTLFVIESVLPRTARH